MRVAHPDLLYVRPVGDYWLVTTTPELPNPDAISYLPQFNNRQLPIPSFGNISNIFWLMH